MYNKGVEMEHETAMYCNYDQVDNVLISTDGCLNVFYSWKHMSNDFYEINFYKTMILLAALNLCLCSMYYRGYFRYIDRKAKNLGESPEIW